MTRMDSAQLGLTVACRRIVELVTDYLEGAMDPGLRARFAAHLSICPPCVDYVRQFDATLQMLGQVPLENLSDETRTGVLAAFGNAPLS